MEAGQAGIRLLGDRADQCEARESSAGRPVPADIEVDTAKSWERIGWQADPEGARLPHHGEYFTASRSPRFAPGPRVGALTVTDDCSAAG